MKHRFVTITLSVAEAAAVENEIEQATLDNNQEAWRARLLNNACSKINAANLIGHNNVHAKGGDLVADLARMVQDLLNHDSGNDDASDWPVGHDPSPDDGVFSPAVRRKAEALVARVWGDPPPTPAERVRRIPGRKPGMRVAGGVAD